jgi:hypothetical protein
MQNEETGYEEGGAMTARAAYRRLSAAAGMEGDREESLLLSIPRWQAWFIASVMGAIALAEWVFAYQNVAYGIVISLGLAIGIYLLLSLLPWSSG